MTSTPARGVGRSRGEPVRPLSVLALSPALLVLLLAGLALRLLVAYVLFPGSGFESDLASYAAWASTMAEHGPAAAALDPFFPHVRARTKPLVEDPLVIREVRRFAEINYGPWDRLDGDRPFVDGVGPKPKGARFYPTPDYTPSIYRLELNPATGAFAVKDVIALKTASGSAITGLLNPQKAAKTDQALDAQGNKLPFDANTIDAEGLDLVTFYSRNLGVPGRRDVGDPQVLRGKQVFYDTGCTDCHRPSFVTHRLQDQPEPGIHVAEIVPGAQPEQEYCRRQPR